MRAMRLEKVGAPLRAAEMAEPAPGPGQVLIRVRACGRRSTPIRWRKPTRPWRTCVRAESQARASWSSIPRPHGKHAPVFCNLHSATCNC